MLELLTSVEAGGDEATGLAALRALAGRPGAVIRLDVAARGERRSPSCGRR